MDHDNTPATTPSESPLPDPSLRFDVVPYRPERGGSLLGAFLLFLLLPAIGVALGYGVSFINHWLYIGLVYAAVMGLVLGIVGIMGITMLKLRRPLLTGLATFCGGLAAVASMHYFDYQRVRSELAGTTPHALKIWSTELETEVQLQQLQDAQKKREVGKDKLGKGEKLKLAQLSSQIQILVLKRKVRGLDPEMKKLLDDPALADPGDLRPALRQFMRTAEPDLRARIESASDNPGFDRGAEVEGLYRPWVEQFHFVDYLEARARQGVVIPPLPRINNPEVNLGYVGSYLFWSVEALLAAGLAAFLLRFGYDEPFCSRCNTWKAERLLGKLTLDSPRAVRIFASGELGRIQKQDVAVEGGPIHVKAAICPNCRAEAPIDVKVEALALKKDDDNKELLHATYPGAALPVLENLFTPTPAPIEESATEPRT